MSDLEVQFHGICTHVIPGDDWRHSHRVVLPRPSVPTPYHQHDGRLLIPIGAAEPHDVMAFANESGGALDLEPTSSVYSLRLNGVSLSVANGTGTYSWDPKSFRCGIFQLSDYANEQPMGPPNRDVVHGRNRERAHAYFEITNGVVSARVIDESAAAVLNVDTFGAPVLRAVPFDPQGTTTELVLSRGAQIVMTHTADGSKNDHFLLHFELATNKPQRPKYPNELPICIAYGAGLGPGCSNSTYP